MLDTREIHPLTDFLRNHKAHMTRLKETHAPEVLTVNGKAEIVIQDAQSYQHMLDRLHHMETIAAIQEGMASAERGELKPAAQVFEEMRAAFERIPGAGLWEKSFIPEKCTRKRILYKAK